ncbi:MAG: folylpolyglutamate synthase/dihydrofolate synthase family protein [Jiangellales bacterium]
MAEPGAADTAPDTDRYAQVQAALLTRWPENKLEPSLDRIAALVDLLGDPQRAYPVIHVAGTNGKSSTARMVESVLRAFGLRTGLVTSPHLVDVRERILIDGEPISAERFVEIYDDIEPYLGLVDAQFHDTPLSYFEVLTAMAFAGFADTPVEVAVIETGMGGTWDATNVADGAVAVITPIDLDHMEYLGPDIEAIAGEKAGIIKDGAVAVLAQQKLPAAEVLLTRSGEVGAGVLREGLEFGVRHRAVAVGGQLLALQTPAGVYDEVFLPLHGAHQAHNAALALAAVEVFFGAGDRMIEADTIREGFAAVASPGRMEVVRTGPTVMLDAAHNPHGAQALATALVEEFSFDRLVGVVGVLADKDAAGLLGALEPVLDSVVVTQAATPRVMPVDDLAAIAVEVFGDDRVIVEPGLPDALDAAIALVDDPDATGGTGVVVTGSVITAGQARALLAGS